MARARKSVGSTNSTKERSSLPCSEVVVGVLRDACRSPGGRVRLGMGLYFQGGAKEFSRVIVLTLWLEKINSVEDRTPLYYKMLIL